MRLTKALKIGLVAKKVNTKVIATLQTDPRLKKVKYFVLAAGNWRLAEFY